MAKKKSATSKKPAAKSTKKIAAAKTKSPVAKSAKKKAATKKAAPATKPAAKKPAPKAAPKPPKKKSAPLVRRDATGHLNPKLAADLRRRSKEDRLDEGRAFLRGARSKDGLAETLGEEAVGAMTSGEDQSEDVADQIVDEERGGPFVQTSGESEFARGTDASNPRGAKREPFPKT